MNEGIPDAWWMKSDGCLEGWMHFLWSKPTVPSANVSFLGGGTHLREDEEKGGRADQEAGGRADRDEGAGFQWVGAAGGHPVLSTLIRGSSLTKATAAAPCAYLFVCVSFRTKPRIDLRALGNENHTQKREREEKSLIKPELAAAVLSAASRLSRQAAAHKCRLRFILKVELLLRNHVKHCYTTLRPHAAIWRTAFKKL